jgi:hypothetical protein
MNKDKLLTLFMGKCWHEWKEIYPTNNHTIRSSPTFECRYCGEYFTDNPDFSQPAQWHEFFVWLTKEREDMWEAFWWYCYHVEGCPRIDWDVARWLFSDLSRFTNLFADFLCLPETIEQWGWEECLEYGVVDGKSCIFTCIKAQPCKNGKILVPWARYASEKPVQISDKKEEGDGL